MAVAGQQWQGERRALETQLSEVKEALAQERAARLEVERLAAGHETAETIGEIFKEALLAIQKAATAEPAATPAPMDETAAGDQVAAATDEEQSVEVSPEILAPIREKESPKRPKKGSKAPTSPEVSEPIDVIAAAADEPEVAKAPAPRGGKRKA